MMAEEKIIGKLLFSEEQIQARAKEIAGQIDKDFKGEEVILLCTLKGSVLWFSDILRYMKTDAKIDFLSASSYGASTVSSGVVKISFESSAPCSTSRREGRTMLLPTM